MDRIELILRSGAFVDGGRIPAKYTCMGKDVSPPLSWQGVPGDSKSLVLIVDDPDAPDPAAPKMTWVHWVVYNIPVDVHELVEGASIDHMPPGAEEGLNDWNNIGYGGPCPPIGMHHYYHKLYALDCFLSGLNKPDKDNIETAMQGHIIESAQLVGTFIK